MNSASVLSGVLFGGIGAAALLYGHRQARWKPMVIGALLVAVSYLVKNTALIWLAGSALTGSLWWFRD
jgi:hypothetical protein